MTDQPNIPLNISPQSDSGKSHSAGQVSIIESVREMKPYTVWDTEVLINLHYEEEKSLFSSLASAFFSFAVSAGIGLLTIGPEVPKSVLIVLTVLFSLLALLFLALNRKTRKTGNNLWAKIIEQSKVKK